MGALTTLRGAARLGRPGWLDERKVEEVSNDGAGEGRGPPDPAGWPARAGQIPLRRHAEQRPQVLREGALLRAAIARESPF
jgi:hypothetical protein